MRVTGGMLGGRRIRSVSGNVEVRPTSDRVREALFTRLGSLDGVRALDLYAGTGTLGIEAISRGARSVVFVDRSVRAIAVLRANLRDLGVADRARIVRAEVGTALQRLGRQPEAFSLVLMDPPYANSDFGPVLEALVAQRLLLPGAMVVVESGKRHPVEPVDGLARLDERRYGDTVVTRLITPPDDDSGSKDQKGSMHAR